MTFAGMRSKLKLNKLFLLTVVLPTLIALIYYGLIASDVFISYSKFVVRSPDKPSSSGLGIILQSAGFSNAGDETYAAQAFVQSRDALKALNRGQAFERAYTRPEISIFDRFNPFGGAGTFEKLYKLYSSKVSIEHSTTTGVSTLTVKSYTPEDAEVINRRLLEMAEVVVNRLNERGRQDMIRSAATELDAAKARAQRAAQALADYRNRQKIVDPEKQAAVQMQMISKLQDELISRRTQLAVLKRYTPRNSQVEVLSTSISALEQEITEQMRMVAGNRSSLAGQAARYQGLVLESQIADRQLAGALTSLQDARNDATRKQAYVERIVEPSRPDAAEEPGRIRGIFAVFAIGLVSYLAISMLLAGLREHQD